MLTLSKPKDIHSHTSHDCTLYITLGHLNLNYHFEIKEKY